MFKRIKCRHENVQTLTNIYGDNINRLNARSIQICINCGKMIYKDSLDPNCNRQNEFNLNKYILAAETIGDISDGYHTFDELYHHRMVLFAVICNTYKEEAWKSWKHADGTMYKDYFIVGITTPEGDYSYHYHKDNWDMFKVKELLNAPEWDGHKPSDIGRLNSLL